MGERPVELSKAVIDEIRALEDEEGMVRIESPSRYNSGDTITVVDGPLLGCTGVFECIDPNHRITILVDFFGRQIRARLTGAAIA